MRFLRNRKIFVQVISIPIGALIGFIAIASAIIVSNNLSSAAQEMQNRTIAILRNVAAVQVGFLQERRAEKDFFLRLDLKYAEKHAATAVEVTAALENLINLTGQDGETERVAAIQSAFDAYVAQFADVVKIRQEIGLTASEGLRGKLEKTIAKAETLINASNSAPLQVSLLKMRRAEQSFLTSVEPAYIEEQKRELDAFMALAKIHILNGDDQEYISDMGQVYFASFQKVAKRLLAEVDARKKLSTLYSDAEPLLDKLMQDKNASFDATAAQVAKDTQAAFYAIVGVTLVVAVVVLTLGFIVGPGLSRPLQVMTRSMTALSRGETATQIPAKDYRSEVGEMAQALQVFKDTMIETENLRAGQEEAKKRAEAERREAMLVLAERFESNVGGVVGAISTAADQLHATAKTLTANADETSRQSNVVSTASDEMAQSVQMVAAATEELTSSIREIGGQVSESTRIVDSAVTQANETNAAVNRLSEAASKIGTVVTLINEIAGQTNLLALNATIEAARAGEAGKGFAVVASEVKGLATQTAAATEEIASQVKAIQDSTNASAQAMLEISHTVNRVSEISTAIASAVEEQGAATQEISRNVQQTAAGTAEVSSSITGVKQASEQTSAGSSQVLIAAGELARNGATLKAQVDEFLREIRAG